MEFPPPSGMIIKVKNKDKRLSTENNNDSMQLPRAQSAILFLQVAVALSHAAILEESMRARDQLMEQNVALDLARQEAEMAIRARNDFLAVMNHEMGTPMHAVITLSSLLLETELTPDQRMMIETVLKSGNLLAALINDVLDLSRLEDGSLELDNKIFNLHDVFREVKLKTAI